MARCTTRRPSSPAILAMLTAMATALSLSACSEPRGEETSLGQLVQNRPDGLRFNQQHAQLISRWLGLLAIVAVQLIAGILGVWAAHLMFDLPVLQLSHHGRTGPGQWLGEFIATFGLLLTIIGTLRHRPAAVPASVALYITAAYWFTSSTSFANPAITIARSLSDSFAGIAPGDAPAFILAQCAGALSAHGLAHMLFPDQGR